MYFMFFLARKGKRINQLRILVLTMKKNIGTALPMLTIGWILPANHPSLVRRATNLC